MSIADWARDNRRAVGLLVIVLMLGGVWVWFFSGIRGGPEMIVLHRIDRGGNRVVFNLSDEYDLKTVTMLDDTGTEVWRLERGFTNDQGEEEELEPVDTFVYGRRILGMTPTVPRTRLEPGRTYTLVIDARGGNAEHMVEMPERTPGN